MHDQMIEASMPAVVLEGSVAAPRKASAPTVWEQLGGVYTEPVALFQRLADRPRWGQALMMVICTAWIMMAFWALKVDVDAVQRPILEANGQLSAAQIEQTIALSSRFILPMTIFTVVVRNFSAIVGLGLIFWLCSLLLDRARKVTFLQALSASSVPNLALLPYMLMVTVVCMARPIGGKIPERLAPSGLAYYLRPENPKLYGFLAQVDPFIIGYFALLYVAVRHTMRMKTRDAALITALAVIITVSWKVYFWV
jgi:hypothetical protein